MKGCLNPEDRPPAIGALIRQCACSKPGCTTNRQSGLLQIQENSHRSYRGSEEREAVCDGPVFQRQHFGLDSMYDGGSW